MSPRPSKLFTTPITDPNIFPTPNTQQNPRRPKPTIHKHVRNIHTEAHVNETACSSRPATAHATETTASRLISRRKGRSAHAEHNAADHDASTASSRRWQSTCAAKGRRSHETRPKAPCQLRKNWCGRCGTVPRAYTRYPSKKGEVRHAIATGSRHVGPINTRS